MIAIMASGFVTAQAQDDVQSENNQVDEEIVVEGVRGAELNAREAERSKDIFSSIITQDDAGNFADQNVAESLQRLPGITLQKSEGEGKFINLRGLGPGFVSVNMNGSDLANAGGGPEGVEDRGFSLDAIPADVLQSIEVLKTLTPDHDLDSIGGSVNVKTLSALDRGRDSLKVTAQGFYQEFSEEWSPKFTLQGTKLLADDTFGIGYSLSYEERVTQVYETRHHNTDVPRYIQVDDTELPPPTAGSPRMLIPWELENRQENAERERMAVLIDFEYRPSDTSKYFARLSRTEYTDNDEALREYYRFAQSGDEETAYIDLETNTFGVGGADLQHQFFIQESTTITDVFSVGGENLFGENWTLNYDLSTSRAEDEKPDGRRVQFRLRDLAVLGRFGPEFINGQVVTPAQLAELGGLADVAGTGGNGPSGYQPGEVVQPFMLYDNIFIEPGFREDTIDQLTLDLRKDYNSGFVNYIKTGFKIQNRERDRDRDRASVVPGDKAIEGCMGDLECVTFAGSRLGDFETYISEQPAFDHAFITRSEAERLLAITRPIADNYDPDNVEIESNRLDYNLTEDTSALYFMAEFQLSDHETLIAGARYEQTDFESDGYLTIRNDRSEDPDSLTSLDIAIPLEGTSNSYSDIFPSLHYRNELREDLLIRAALWTSFSRPSFEQNRAFAEIADRVIFCNNDSANSAFGECSDDPADLQGDELNYDDAYKADNLVLSPENSFRFGNPKLDPMTSVNLDFSIGWYASEDLFLQAAIFYKDIDDFIVDVSGADIALNQLAFTLPVDQVTAFVIPSDLVVTNGTTYLNGEGAEVYGLELTYNHYFTQGMLNGFFIQSNLTFLDSEASVGETIRASEIQLPDQADVTYNLTLGWENDDISVRFITNYHSEILKRIGACTAADIQADAVAGFPENCRDWADVYQDEAVSYDIKATYQITDDLKLYFDALNITDEVDFHYFEGNRFSNGNILFRSERYGNSYQIGLNYRFM
ncbi:MAG TPA: TonB-dependent receptor [Gammaproteobacteria bacterium]